MLLTHENRMDKVINKKSLMNYQKIHLVLSLKGVEEICWAKSMGETELEAMVVALLGI
jgi:hypothetical protein